MSESYPAASLAAPSLQAHFERHLASARARGVKWLAALPDADTIAHLANVAFWASLRREEGFVPKISLAFLSPEQSTHPLRFDRPLKLTPRTLSKVAPVVERPGIHLGVWPIDGELAVWGITRTVPSFCFVLEVIEPGLLVVKHHRGGITGKFVNVAVLEGDRIKIVDENASSLPECPDLMKALLGFDSPVSWIDTFNIRVQLAVSMRAHGRGGSLLLVPEGSLAWRESIAQPIPYAVEPALRELADLMASNVGDDQSLASQEACRQSVDAIAGLTAVDGATILTDQYELLAFGAKITRRRGATPVDQVTMTEPIEGGEPSIIEVTQLGGTRHLSAAQFVHDQRDSVALVASQDRRFTIFAWSPCEDMVHAHRVETLLM